MRLRLITLVLFVVFALLELSDAFGNLQILVAPQASAAALNLTIEQQVTRATILLALSALIAVASAVTALGVWQNSKLVYAWVVVALGYIVYGLYQMASALLQSNAPGFALTEVVYLLLGAAAFSFGRQASRTLKR
jgi:hypothetical protein